MKMFKNITGYFKWLNMLRKNKQLGNYFRRVLKDAARYAYERVFLNFYFVGLAILFFCVNLFIWQKPGQIHFNFPKPSEAEDIMETIIRTIAVLMGLIAALTTLSFNAANRYYGRMAFYEFFKSRLPRSLFTFFIITVIFLIYSFYYFKGITGMTPYAKSLFVWSLSLSLTFTITLFPIAIKMLSFAQSRGNILPLINKIDFDQLSIYWNDFHNGIRKLDDIEKDPVRGIIEVGTTAVKDFDNTSLDIILESAYKKFTTLLLEDKYGEYIGFIRSKHTTILSALFQIGVNSKNEYSIINIVREKFHFESFVIKNYKKFGSEVADSSTRREYDSFLHLIEVNRFFAKAMQANEDRACTEIIDEVRDYICLVIKEYFPDHVLRDPKDLMMGMQSQMFVSEITRCLKEMMMNIKNFKKYFLYKNVSNLFTTIDLGIPESRNNMDSKIYLFRVMATTRNECFKMFVDSGVTDVSSPYYVSSGLGFLGYYKHKIVPHEYIATVFNDINILFSKDLLNTMAINDLRALAYGIISDFNKDPSYNKPLLMSIINKFDKIRSVIKENDSNRKKENYLKLHEHLKAAMDYMLYHAVSDPAVISFTNEVLAKFEFLAKFDTELKASGHIFDDSIVLVLTVGCLAPLFCRNRGWFRNVLPYFYNKLVVIKKISLGANRTYR